MLEAFGFVTALCVGWFVVLAIIAVLCFASNRVSHMVLESYGGWVTFQKFRKWYRENEVKDKV